MELKNDSKGSTELLKTVQKGSTVNRTKKQVKTFCL